ncbi:MAG: 3-keto-5-aminohexanoate cleavage protein [Magnetococcales bacterium]|nr:3-keto-5-aminohexanoate cleavage protein [Magnetococcales bacterium]
MSEPFTVNLAPTGAVATPDVHARVPVTSEAIQTDVGLCVDSGVTMVHLHARDNEGFPTWQPESMGRIIRGIRHKHPELVLVASTSGRGALPLEKRSAVLGLTGISKPDMASLTLGSVTILQWNFRQ